MATTAVSSSFAMQGLKCIGTNATLQDHHHHHSFLKIPSAARAPQKQHASLAHYSFVGIIEPSSISGGVCTRWRPSRVAAAVAQEEAEVAFSLDGPAASEEDPEEAAAVGGGGDEAEGDGGVNTKLYIGNLPYHCDSAQLAGIIQEYASPELIEVLYDRDTGKSRGFAFVTMSNIEDCNVVIENLDGCEFGGRTLRVNFSDRPKPKLPLYPETENKLFVGNLSWSVTSEILTSAFQDYGNVVGARVLYDGETGKSRGYGFVSYESKQEMEAALEALNGVELEGRAMRISLAQGKRQ